MNRIFDSPTVGCGQSLPQRWFAKADQFRLTVMTRTRQTTPPWIFCRPSHALFQGAVKSNRELSMDFMFQDIIRSEHPLDMIERLAAFQDWTFDRAETDEMSVSVSGRWTDYNISLTWIEDVEALHIACAFDLRIPQLRRAEVLNLISSINEQLWVGHFDLWSSENVVVHRQALVLAGGACPTQTQCETMVNIATETCERHYQAFQFVVWAGKTARQALDDVLFATEGEA